MPEQDTPQVTAEDKRRNAALAIAIQQVEEGLKFKQPRMQEVSENEAVNLGKKRPALRNRFNVPFDTVVMQGAIETVLAQSDDAPLLSFDSEEEEYKRSSNKVTRVFQKESGDDKGRWAAKDRLAKKMAYLSGRAIFEKYTTSSPKFKDVLKVEDHYNFYCEPGGGPYLEDHLFCGTVNNFFSKEDLVAKGNSGMYIASEVQKLINNTSSEREKKIKDEYGNIKKRFQALGLDISQFQYTGQTLFNLVKHEMEYEGERYYMLFDIETQACVRFEKLTDRVSPSGRYSWVSWATHEDMVFWSRAYADTIRPVGEIYRVLVNQMLENIQKRNWNMRAYDPSVFTDSAKLLYSPDGLVKANLKPGMTSVSQGIFELQTPETTSVTLNAIEWLNGFLGEKTGITPGTQGNSADAKVGIYYGNVKQTAERFGLLNKQYLQAWIDLGVLFDWGLYRHCPEDYMVKTIGLNGVGWEAITKEDVEPDFSVNIVSANALAAETEQKAVKRENAIALLMKDPAVAAKVNPGWLATEILRSGSYEEEDIRVALDTATDADRNILLHAAEAIRQIVDGKKPKLCFGATTGFMQKIVTWANEHYDEISMEKYHELNIYALAHKKIVVENMTRRAMIIAASKGVQTTDLSLPGGTPGMLPTPAPSPTPAPAAPTMPAPVMAPGA